MLILPNCPILIYMLYCTFKQTNNLDSSLNEEFNVILNIVTYAHISKFYHFNLYIVYCAFKQTNNYFHLM